MGVDDEFGVGRGDFEGSRGGQVEMAREILDPWVSSSGE